MEARMSRRRAGASPASAYRRASDRKYGSSRPSRVNAAKPRLEHPRFRDCLRRRPCSLARKASAHFGLARDLPGWRPQPRRLRRPRPIRFRPASSQSARLHLHEGQTICPTGGHPLASFRCRLVDGPSHAALRRPRRDRIELQVGQPTNRAPREEGA